MYKISQKGIDLIKRFEGCVLHSYRDVAGVLTIGYGHTGKDVKENQVITQARADELLRQDLNYFIQGVNNAVKVPLNQNQFDALVSFAYNCGLGALQSSTMLQYLNQKKYSQASQEFDRWVHARGKVIKGLVNRRNAEQELFNKPVQVAHGHKYHPVIQGENLSKIAKYHNVSLAALIEWNKNEYPTLATNPGLIKVGWKLRVR